MFAIAADAAVGDRSVTVATAAGTSAARTFTITVPRPPTLASVSPAAGVPGAEIAATLTGTNFVPGATNIAIAGGGVSATGVTVASTTSITATFAIDAAAVPGVRMVTVTTAAGTSSPEAFMVALAAPTLTALRQPDGATGTTRVSDPDRHQLRGRRDNGQRERHRRDRNERDRHGSTSLNAGFVVDPRRRLARAASR